MPNQVKTYPRDWFDIEPATFADLGAMIYLSALTQTHQARTLAQAVSTYEPPLRLNQYKIFRQNGYPRAFVTYAALSPAAERKYALEQRPLSAADYTSGTSFWIVDLVSPFGQIAQIRNILKETLPFDRMRANRLDADMHNPRIVEWTRAPDKSVGIKVYRKREFESLLKAEALKNG